MRYAEAERVRDDDAGSNARREVGYWHIWYDDPSCNYSSRRHEHTVLLIGISQMGVRVRFPHGTRSPVEYLPNPTPDFQAITALWVCSLVPTGVYADALEDNYQDRKQEADFLREIERRQQMEVKP